MRYVAWGHFQPSEEWKNKAKQALDKLVHEADVKKRNEIIDNNTQKYILFFIFTCSAP